MAEKVWRQWQETSQRFLDETALWDAATTGSYTFRELGIRVDKAAEDLVSMGVGRGQVVALSMINGPDWIVSFLAIQSISAVALPLDPQLGETTVKQMADLAGARVILGPMRQRLAGNRRYRGDVCLIKTTSGSTGSARNFVFRDEEMLADGRHIIDGMALSREEINYALIPFGHSYGLGNLIIPLILEGIPMVCGRHYFPAAIIADWVRYQPTVFPAVPPLIRALSGYPAPQPLRLKQVISAGGKLLDSVRDKFMATHGVLVSNFYGSTETGGISYTNTTPKLGEPIGVGKPLPGVNVEIDAMGSIIVSSAAVYTYGNRHRKEQRGRVRLADHGYWTESGQLMLAGRRGREVKIAGRRISLETLENQLLEIEGVTDSYVAAIPGVTEESALGVIVAGSIDKAALKVAIKEASSKEFVG